MTVKKFKMLWIAGLSCFSIVILFIVHDYTTKDIGFKDIVELIIAVVGGISLTIAYIKYKHRNLNK